MKTLALSALVALSTLLTSKSAWAVVAVGAACCAVGADCFGGGCPGCPDCP